MTRATRRRAATGGTAAPTTYEGENTTHLTVADKWGNVVSYTLTIESDRRQRHHRARAAASCSTTS